MQSIKTLGKEELLKFFSKLDSKLQEEGYQRSFSIYLIGGSLLSLITPYRFTRDVDFITPRRDYLSMSGSIRELEKQCNLRVDVFPDGELPGFSYPSFQRYAQQVQLRFTSFTLYRIDDTGFVLLKILAGREIDRDDLKIFQER